MTAPTTLAAVSRHHVIASATALISALLSVLIAALGYVQVVAPKLQSVAGAAGTAGTVVSLLALVHVHIKTADAKAWLVDTEGVLGTAEHLATEVKPALTEGTFLAHLGNYFQGVHQSFDAVLGAAASHKLGLDGIVGTLGNLVSVIGGHKDQLAEIKQLISDLGVQVERLANPAAEVSPTMAAQAAEPPVPEPVVTPAPAVTEVPAAPAPADPGPQVPAPAPTLEPAPIPDVAGADVTAAAQASLAAPVPPGTGV